MLRRETAPDPSRLSIGHLRPFFLRGCRLASVALGPLWDAVPLAMGHLGTSSPLRPKTLVFVSEKRGYFALFCWYWGFHPPASHHQHFLLLVDFDTDEHKILCFGKAGPNSSYPIPPIESHEIPIFVAMAQTVP